MAAGSIQCPLCIRRVRVTRNSQRDPSAAVDCPKTVLCACSIMCGRPSEVQMNGNADIQMGVCDGFRESGLLQIIYFSCVFLPSFREINCGYATRTIEMACGSGGPSLSWLSLSSVHLFFSSWNIYHTSLLFLHYSA